MGSAGCTRVLIPVSVAALGGDPESGEADMGLITTGGQLGARHRHTIAAAFWAVVGIVALLTLGDALAFLGIALVIVTTAWWVAQRVTGRDARP